jgi:hypothetical protein
LALTEDDHKAYHVVGWMNDGLDSSISEVDAPLVDVSTMVCFESHLVAIMNFLRCELVHFNPNAIAALSYFTMLCECWLGIAPDTSQFWYFYSLS